MRSAWDVQRSVKKYVGELVLPGYEVRLSSEEGAWERPFARVAWATPSAITMIGARQVETRRTLSIVAWPALVSEDAGPGAATEAAEDLVERLTVGFAAGLHVPSYAPDRNRAHPFRIPLYDYDGVDLNEAATDSERATTDFVWVVEEPNVGTVRDPDTDLSLLVTCDLRLRWTRSVAVVDTSPVVETVTADPADPSA
jgi:hypothetical protein